MTDRPDVPGWLALLFPCLSDDCGYPDKGPRHWCGTCHHRHTIAAHPEFVAMHEKAEALDWLEDEHGRRSLDRSLRCTHMITVEPRESVIETIQRARQESTDG